MSQIEIVQEKISREDSVVLRAKLRNLNVQKLMPVSVMDQTTRNNIDTLIHMIRQELETRNE
jgi:hypothetical protein